MDENEDRISALPDSIIHHILSFLPSTEEAVKTGVLSKRWQYQWTRVPVLSFIDCGKSPENFRKFVEYTIMLHECLKINKFRLYYARDDQFAPDRLFAAKIHFATRRHVQELDLANSPEPLPIFLFNHASLVKLKTSACTCMPDRMVNWRRLTELNIREGKLTDQAMEYILSGSPSLKLFELREAGFDKLVIASKSLKKLYLHDIYCSTIDVSCPSLEKLALANVDSPHMFPQAIENIVCGSSSLESFELWDFSDTLQLPKLVIASKSLKRLGLGGGPIECGALEISCPKLERLKLFGCLTFQTVKLVNLPSSLCATINLFHYNKEKLNIHMIKDILESLHYVKQLKFSSPFIKRVSDIAIKEGHCHFVPKLNTKCLILYSDGLNEYHHGIACILDHSNVLEELIIKVDKHNQEYDYPEKLNEFGENYWNSNTTVFHCLASHLKTIKIIGFPHRDHNRKLVLKFVQFVLKNARVLEKVVVQLKDKDSETTTSICQELLSMSRYSQSAKFELICSY